MYQETVEVLWNKQVGPDYFQMGLSCDPGYQIAGPGQFIMVRFLDELAPLLRRPFSIHRLVSDSSGILGIELLYKVVGEGTRKLSLCNSGESLDMLGPLGRGFSVSEDHRNIFIAAGGIGVAPMVFLADVVKKQAASDTRIHVFLGGRSKADILCKETLAGMGLSVCITTDDGTEGDQCLVTSPLEMEAGRIKPDIIYACGPMEMLKCVVGIARQHAILCEISIETAMACGIGVCLGCAVEKKGASDVSNDNSDESSDKYLHACLDGPVFDADAIRL